MIKILTCLTEQHDLRLVSLSAFICVLGCFTTVTLLGRAGVSGGFAMLGSLVAASVIFGCGVWALHFIAMLAFMPQTTLAYAVSPTIASVLVSVGGALAAFLIWRLRPLSVASQAVAGLALGLAVAGMHYVGVMAMALPGILLLDEPYVAASIGVSVAASTVALVRACTPLSILRRAEATMWLALAICGVHFIGMTAVRIVPGPMSLDGGAVLGSTTLAVAVGAVSLVILLVSLIATTMEQHLSHRALQELGRMRLLSNLSQEILLILRDDSVQEINLAGERLFGSGRETILGKPLIDLFAPGSVPALLRRARCAPENRRPEEVEIRTSTGQHVPVELSCQPIAYRGKPATVVVLRDLSDRKRNEARIRHLAHHDALTDLPNRLLLEERLAHTLDEAGQSDRRVAVLYMDLDRFKPVNDLLGHAAGDTLLIQVAGRIGSTIKPADTLARIGGDEFVIVLAQAESPALVSSFAAQVIESLRRPFIIEGHEVTVGASIGVALYPFDGTQPEALLRAADTAMYRVKQDERGTLRFFERRMDQELQARRHLERELDGAADRGELALFYQPIVNGRTGEIESFEALIRWHHPRRGMVSPAEFIPIAEQTDLIARIGRWVIDTACATAAGWPQPWRVAVNVSPAQFRHSDVPAIVAAALARNELDPGRLVVEITEAVFIDDAAKAVRVLVALRKLGIRIALDDFGTGFSSLSYLQLFRFDKFKIDRSFVAKLEDGGDALTIVKAIVNLGHNLGLHVTAEGVETAAQASVIRLLGCEQMQGYFFGRPGPAETVRAYAPAAGGAVPARLAG